MVYPSGEVETLPQLSELICPTGSGWFIHPGKLKPRLAPPGRTRENGSGWFIHPGKLKPEGEALLADRPVVPDGLSIRGS